MGTVRRGGGRVKGRGVREYCGGDPDALSLNLLTDLLRDRSPRRLVGWR